VKIFNKCETACYREKQLNCFSGWQAFWKAYPITAVFAFRN